MNLFIDTEFSDPIDMKLISIALVSKDGRTWYAEKIDADKVACSEFVRQVVLPLLGRQPQRVMAQDVMKADLLAWLAQFEEEGATICFDYTGDWTLFAELIENVPAWICGRNIRHEIDEQIRRSYFRETGLPMHHALYDANANRFAFRSRLPESQT